MNALDFTNNHLIELKDIIEYEKNGVDFTVNSGESRSPLHNIAYLGKSDILDYLLSKGMDPNIKTPFGKTPLMELFRSPYFNVDSAKILLKHGANLLDKDINSRTIYEYTDRNPIFEEGLTDVGRFLWELVYESEYRLGKVVRTSLSKDNVEFYLKNIEEAYSKLSLLTKEKLIIQGLALEMVNNYINLNQKYLNQYKGATLALNSWRPIDYNEIYNFINQGKYLQAMKLIMNHGDSGKWGWFYDLCNLAKEILIKTDEREDQRFRFDNSYHMISECIKDLERAQRNFSRVQRDNPEMEFGLNHYLYYLTESGLLRIKWD